jgi:transcriptional regulator with XRE-family HTH domain
MPDLLTRIGRNIVRLRGKEKQQDIADWARVSRKHLSRIENGEAEAGILVLEKIAHALGKEIADLLK